jgi:hypothetical protein
LKTTANSQSRAILHAAVAKRPPDTKEETRSTRPSKEVIIRWNGDRLLENITCRSSSEHLADLKMKACSPAYTGNKITQLRLWVQQVSANIKDQPVPAAPAAAVAEARQCTEPGKNIETESQPSHKATQQTNRALSPARKTGGQQQPAPSRAQIQHPQHSGTAIP